MAKKKEEIAEDKVILIKRETISDAKKNLSIKETYSDGSEIIRGL